jgi:hypothetical protein
MVGTFAVVGSQYEYSIPSGFEFIHDMHFVPTTGSDYEALLMNNWDAYRVPRHAWSVENKTIVFHPYYIDLDDYDGEYLRILGQGKPDPLEDDEDTFDDVLEEYLVAYATMHLSRRRIDEGQEWLQKYLAARDELIVEQDRISQGVFEGAERVR